MTAMYFSGRCMVNFEVLLSDGCLLWSRVVMICIGDKLLKGFLCVRYFYMMTAKLYTLTVVVYRGWFSRSSGVMNWYVLMSDIMLLFVDVLVWNFDNLKFLSFMDLLLSMNKFLDLTSRWMMFEACKYIKFFVVLFIYFRILNVERVLFGLCRYVYSDFLL